MEMIPSLGAVSFPYTSFSRTQNTFNLHTLSPLVKHNLMQLLLDCQHRHIALYLKLLESFHFIRISEVTSFLITQLDFQPLNVTILQRKYSQLWQKVTAIDLITVGI